MKTDLRKVLLAMRGLTPVECARCSWKWMPRPNARNLRLKKSLLEAVTAKLRGQTLVLALARDREKLSRVLSTELNRVFASRVCPHCNSPYWQEPARRPLAPGAGFATLEGTVAQARRAAHRAEASSSPPRHTSKKAPDR